MQPQDKRRDSLWIAVLSSVFVLGCGTGDVAGRTPDEKSQAIKSAYEKLSGLVSSTENTFSLKVNSISKASYESQQNRRLLDLLTSTDEAIDVARHVYHSNHRPDTASYSAAWTASAWPKKEWEKHTLKTALIAANRQQSLRDVFLVNVTVQLKNHRLTYNTLAIERATSSGDEFEFLDQVIGPHELMNAVTETLPLNSNAQPASFQGDPSLNSANTLTPRCAPKKQTYSSYTKFWWDETDHATQSHYSYNVFTPTCSRDEYCVMNCTVNIDYDDSGDNGLTYLYVHYTHKDIQHYDASGASGTGTVECSAAVGFGVNLCTLLPCGAGIGVSWNGASWQFTSGSGGDHRTINSQSFKCPSTL